MMETVIAIGVGVVVGGGILTLVWRILTGDREQRRLEEELARFKKPEAAGAAADTGGKKKRKGRA